MDTFKKILSMVPGILLVLPGAFMVADSVLAMLGNDAIFFPGLEYKFELVIGYALVILGASQFQKK